MFSLASHISPDLWFQTSVILSHLLKTNVSDWITFFIPYYRKNKYNCSCLKYSVFPVSHSSSLSDTEFKSDKHGEESYILWDPKSLGNQQVLFLHFAAVLTKYIIAGVIFFLLCNQRQLNIIYCVVSMSLNNMNYNHKRAFRWVENSSPDFFPPLKKLTNKPRNTKTQCHFSAFLGILNWNYTAQVSIKAPQQIYTFKKITGIQIQTKAAKLRRNNRITAVC